MNKPNEKNNTMLVCMKDNTWYSKNNWDNRNEKNIQDNVAEKITQR